MKKLELKTIMHVCEDTAQLTEEDQHLLSVARNSLQHSYSPYSQFKVGAALLLENGEVIPGSNQENASYPLCLCAERVALAAAASLYPGIAVKAIAVTVRNPKKPVLQPATPCGACRQVMVESEERSKADMRVILQGESGSIYLLESAKDLLPLSFGGDFLK